jgi:hypothetical protein
LAQPVETTPVTGNSPEGGTEIIHSRSSSAMSESACKCGGY